MRVETPSTAAEAARLLASGATVRPRGGGTKWSWGAAAPDPDVVLSTAAFTRIEHNAGDLTAVLGAGVRLADAQAAFAEAGQMLALDPPGEGATIGGVVATADSGPLRHRYGAPRDLLLGVTVALADGTVARAGGKVIKNVAGYDLGKLFAGSFGTLGTVVEAVVRLHPMPAATITTVGAGDDPGALARAARALAAAPLELDTLDVAWAHGHGSLLAQVSGVAVSGRAERIAALMRVEGLEATVEPADRSLWAAQRAGQRGDVVLRVSGLPSALETLLGSADELVGRAGLGLCWLRCDPERIPELSFPSVILDGPAELRADPWGVDDAALLALSRRVKERFDPAGVCAPGVFVGGI